MRESHEVMRVVDEMIEAFRERFGEGWGSDEIEDGRFTVESEALLGTLAGAKVVERPARDDEPVTLHLWLEEPVDSLLEADALAYEAFGLISREYFYAERVIGERGLLYRFVTGNASKGFIGELHLVGPHATAFVDRHILRTTGQSKFQA